jgi:hypothetical protein
MVKSQIPCFANHSTERNENRSGSEVSFQKALTKQKKKYYHKAPMF